MKTKKSAKRRPVLPYRNIFPRVTAAAFACSLCWWMPNPVTAGDIEGANVVQGTANIAAGIDPSITNITASDRAIIEYQQFNISSQNTVNFIQPSATSAVLNRIIGNSPSTLNGTLNANGQVFFVNPAGVYFGANSVINAARFHAAAGNISNEDFNAGIMRFTATGTLVNDGMITAADGVTLVGQSVTNNGSIVAANGLVSLSSGDTEYIADGDSRVLVKVDSLTANGQSRAAESNVDGTGVANNGSVEADEVVFSSGDVYSLAIKNTGSVTSTGDTTLASGGDVENTGTIEAGNNVNISGDMATLAAGSIHAGNIASLKVNHFQLGGELTAGKEIYLDPATLTVVDSNAGVDEITNDEIVASLDLGTDVTLAADDTITVDATIVTTKNKAATLALNDNNGGGDLTVNLNAAITLKSTQTLTGEAAVTNVSNGATINNAMDVALEGGTINVAAGTYDEDLSIDKSLTLNGANAGISAVDGVRGAESIIDGDITITADNTTLDGFEQVNFKYNGISIRAENHVTIANNIIHEPNTGVKAAGAILIQPVVNPDKTTATVDDIVITGNLIDIPETHTSTAGLRFTLHNFPNTSEFFIDYNNVTIANNEFITPYRSIWAATSTANFHINNLDITNNNFHDSGTALNLGNMDGNSSITGNAFTNVATAMVVHFREVGGEISGNTLTNVAGSGVYFFDDTYFPAASADATVAGNSFTNVGRHIYAASVNVDVASKLATNTFDKTVFTSSSDNIFGTIQYAVDDAAAGDTVTVSDGTFNENVTIDKELTLLSENGYTSTTIEGVAVSGEAGTVYVNSSNVQIGDVDHGFTIIGIDGNGAVEQAAVYLNGSLDSINVIGNNIVANGDAGLMSESGATVTNATIDSNIFSGQTYAGANPGGEGFSEQFNVGNNVPRQLAVFNGGTTSTNDNIVFTNNQIIGSAGGLNDSNAEQGNTLVTIDAINSTVTGNTFAGTTARYGAALRVRGAGNAAITGNTFDSSNMGDNTAQIYARMATINGVDSFAGMSAVNTFDRGAYVVGSANDANINTTITNTINGATDGDTVMVMAGNYTENLVIDKNVDVIGSGSSTTIIDADGGYGVVIAASGDSDADRLTVSGLTINDASQGVRLASDESHIAIDDVVVDIQGGYGINFNNGSYADVVIANSSFTSNATGTGFKFGTSASMDGLTVSDSHFDNNNFGWYVGIPGSGGTTFTNIAVTNSTFNDSAHEGLYIEKLDNAVFDGITVSGTANTGMKLNLKYEAYDNIQIINSTFTNNGLVGNQGALTFMVRDDGSYAANPASLTNSVISGNTFDGNYVNANFQVPSGIAVTGNSFTNATSGINLSNWTANALDASGNYFGSTDIATVAGTIDGVVDFSPFLINGSDQDGNAAGFQADTTRLMVHTQGSQTDALIAEATNAAGVVEIQVGGGTYDEVVNSPVDLTFIEQVNLSENLSVDGVLTFEDTVSFGVNDVALIANDVEFNGGADSVTGSGNIAFAPLDPTSSIGVSEDAGNNVAGDFWVDAADYLAIADGFASRTFGDAVNGSGVVKVGNITITDPTTFATPQATVGDDILVYGPVVLDYDGTIAFSGDGDTTRILGDISTGNNFAGSGSDVFTAQDSVIFENVNVNTGGGNINTTGNTQVIDSTVNTEGGSFTNTGDAQLTDGGVNTGGGSFSNTGNLNTTGTGTVTTTGTGGGAGGQLNIGGNVTGETVVFESGTTVPQVNGPEGIRVELLQSSTLPDTSVPIISNTENPLLGGETNPQTGQVNGPNDPGTQGGDTQLALNDTETMPFSMQLALNENAKDTGANADPELAQQLDSLFDNFLENQLAQFQLALNDAYSGYMANAAADATMDVRMAGFYNVTKQNDKLTTQFKELLVMIDSVEKLAKSLGLDEAEARKMLFEKVKPEKMTVAEFDALIKAYQSQQ